MKILKPLRGHDLDRLTNLGILEKDLLFMIKNNAHPAGMRILIKLDPERKIGIRINHHCAENHCCIKCKESDVVAWLVQGEYWGASMTGKINTRALYYWMSEFGLKP